MSFMWRNGFRAVSGHGEFSGKVRPIPDFDSFLCLSCGCVELYVDPGALDRFKKRKEKAERTEKEIDGIEKKIVSCCMEIKRLEKAVVSSPSDNTPAVVGQKIGDTSFEKVTAKVVYNIYKIVLKADEGIADVYLNGQAMFYGLVNDVNNTGGYYYAYTATVSAGDYKVTYTLKNGWFGEAKLTGENVTGTESDRDFKHSMSIPLTKIDPIAGIDTPDYVNSEHDIVVEVYSGFIDKVDNRTSSEQVSTIHMNNQDIRDRIMRALRHARDKITPESLDYLQKNYGISSNPVCYAGYSIGSAMYLFIDSEWYCTHNHLIFSL